MDRVKPYNIMLAFASFVSSIEELKYRSSDGTKIFEKCVQSNEPAICEMQDRLHDTGGLDRIILVESDLVNKPVHPNKLNADTWRSLLEFHGKEAMTSVEFLKAQIHKKYPQWQGDFVSSHYSEKDSVQKSMKRVAEITEHIEKTVEEARSKVAPGETLDVVLHADMTGGLRHAVMMMLAVMQMSKRLELFSAAELMHIFAFDLEQFNMKQEKPAEEKPLGKWAKREREYRAMLAGNMECAMHSKMTVDESVEFLHGFLKIRDERNQTNHAAMAGGRENAALEELIESYVERLRNA